VRESAADTGLACAQFRHAQVGTGGGGGGGVGECVGVWMGRWVDVWVQTRRWEHQQRDGGQAMHMKPALCMPGAAHTTGSLHADMSMEWVRVGVHGTAMSPPPAVPLPVTARCSPNVNGCCVVAAVEQQLRGAVPARDNILRHQVLLMAAAAGKAAVDATHPCQ
jgi:hypothetical protein